MNPDDRALARRMLRGEEPAFDEFFAGHFPRLYRFAISRLDQDADAAEEVVQATLCLAIRKLATYRGEASLLTWLCTFCRHEISAFLQRANRRPQAVDLAEESPEVLAALESLWAHGGADPEAELRRKEIAALVHLVLDRLPARQADALEWKYIDGLPVQEIADRLGLGLKAAESVLTRARQAFRDGFAAAGGAAGPRRAPATEPS